MRWLENRLDDKNFWQHQRRGLLMLGGPGMRKEWRLPFEVPELLHVGDRFHLKHAIRTANGRPGQIFHGNASRSERATDDLERYAKAVAQAMEKRRSQMTKAPWLVLAGPQREIGAYRKAANESKVSETSLEGSFDRASDEELRAAG